MNDCVQIVDSINKRDERHNLSYGLGPFCSKYVVFSCFVIVYFIVTLPSTQVTQVSIITLISLPISPSFLYVGFMDLVRARIHIYIVIQIIRFITHIISRF